jgi:hypothetical protein
MQRLFEWLGRQEGYAANSARHVLFAMNHAYMLRPEIRDAPAVKIIPTPWHHQVPPTPRRYGEIVVPLLNPLDHFRPAALAQRPDTWWTRPRKYSFAAVYGGMNPRMGPGQPRRFRGYFSDTLKKREAAQSARGGNHSLGGLPYVFSYGGHGMMERRALQDVYALYADAAFCPILPGDAAHGRRFFDAVGRGCLPVFLRWPAHAGGKSWQFPGAVEALYNYPFHGALYGDAPFRLEGGAAVDYDAFAVEAPGDAGAERDYTAMFAAMEALLEGAPGELRERQRMLQKQVISLMYGLEGEAHRYDDAFFRTLQVLEAYVHKVILGL